MQLSARSATDPAPVSAADRAPDPLRVGFLVHRFPVVSQTFVIEQAAAMRDRGVDLRVLALHPSDPKDGPHHDLVGDSALMSLVARPPTDIGWPRIVRDAVARDRRALWPHAALMLKRPLGVPRILAEARMLTDAGPFDVVHCQFANLGLDALRHLRLGALRTRGLVVHLRGSDVTKFVLKRGSGVYARLFDRADLFIANCAHFRERAIGLGCPPQKVIVIGSPIDMSRFAWRAPEAMRDGPLRLIAVGRLVDKKGFGDLIDAMAVLRDRGVAATLDLIGDGPLMGKLRGASDRLRLGETVRFHGAQTQSQIHGALTAADIAIAPSVTAPDGDADAPVNTLKEAMATGLPVIATRHGGIPELVRDGENGYLVDEQAPAQIAGAVERLAAERGRWRSMGLAGRDRVMNDFAKDHIIDRTLEAYRSILPSRGA